VNLERCRLVFLDELERVVGGLEEVGALEELCASLVARLEDHFEEFVHRLVVGDRPDDGLEFRFVLSIKLDTVLLGQRLSELTAGEQTARDEDLAEAAAFFALYGKCTLELRLGQELEVDEEVAERPPCLRRLGRDRNERCRCTFLGREVNAVLIGQNACERERREVAVADDDLAEEASGLRLSSVSSSSATRSSPS